VQGLDEGDLVFYGIEPADGSEDDQRLPRLGETRQQRAPASRSAWQEAKECELVRWQARRDERCDRR